MTNPPHTPVNHKYLIHGYGNSINVQARLTQHGHCYHTEWSPGPPSWQMFYETTLTEAQVLELVKDLIARFDLKITSAP